MSEKTHVPLAALEIVKKCMKIIEVEALIPGGPDRGAAIAMTALDQLGFSIITVISSVMDVKPQWLLDRHGKNVAGMLNDFGKDPPEMLAQALAQMLKRLPDLIREFDCAGCGNHVVQIIDGKDDNPDTLCPLCRVKPTEGAPAGETIQ